VTEGGGGAVILEETGISTLGKASVAAMVVTLAVGEASVAAVVVDSAAVGEVVAVVAVTSDSF
jgi:hypothetical protein